jgi:GT2 family glycosyltransferase
MEEKVVVITLNYNQNDYTIKCINSLLDSTYKNFIILLIDNGSKEEHYLRLQKDLNKDSRIILKRIVQNCGYVGGINYGLEEGIKLDPYYFIIMNNDTIIDENAIIELVNTCKEYDNKAIITGKVYNYNEPNKLQDIGYIYKDKRKLTIDRIGLNEEDTGQYDYIEERDLIDDIFWLLPTELYIEIGGYSQYFWFNHEQQDLAIRAQKAGYKLIYTPKARIWHKGSVSIGGRDYNPNLIYWEVQSSLILNYIHQNKIQFIKFYIKTLDSIIRTVLKSIYFKVLRKRNIWNYAKAKILALMYFNRWLFKRNINNGYNPLDKM